MARPCDLLTLYGLPGVSFSFAAFQSAMTLLASGSVNAAHS